MRVTERRLDTWNSSRCPRLPVCAPWPCGHSISARPLLRLRRPILAISVDRRLPSALCRLRPRAAMAYCSWDLRGRAKPCLRAPCLPYCRRFPTTKGLRRLSSIPLRASPSILFLRAHGRFAACITALRWRALWAGEHLCIQVRYRLLMPAFCFSTNCQSSRRDRFKRFASPWKWAAS